MRLGKFIKKSGNDYLFQKADNINVILRFVEGEKWLIRYDENDIEYYTIADTLEIIALNTQFTNWFLINGKDL